MKAENLRLNELVEFGDGRLSLQGRRLVLHDINAFTQLRRDLFVMVGPEQARRILVRYGFAWGYADAAAMTRVFTWDDKVEWLKAGPRMLTIQGVARAAVNRIELDEPRGTLEMELTWHDSPEAEPSAENGKLSGNPACWILTGYASGYASFVMGGEVYFIEQRCAARGDKACRALGRDVESWGEELVPHLAYFQAEDIYGKVNALTAELRRKTLELERERHRLDILRRESRRLVIEVHSESFRRVLELANRIARFDSSVLITGETGTGKEVLARHIHENSTRSDNQFVAVNCGALPENLLESELFGHRAGSFTGAIRDQIGLFEQAEKGTIFLDEIGDITAAMQLKILRVLQEREIMRLGERKPRKVDIRVIAATNRDLRSMIAEGTFREDLYYRLGVIEIEVPPLRARREDILPLARYFVERLSRRLKLPKLRLDARCLDYLQAYDWPGNVRELENAIERAAVLSREGTVLPENLPPQILHSQIVRQFRGGLDQAQSLEQVERDYINHVLELAGGNQSRAAAILGIGYSTLWRKLKTGGAEKKTH